MYQLLYYAGLFCLSFLLTLVYVFQWHRQNQVHITAIFILIPIVNLAYLLMYASHEADAVTALLKVVYIGGCFLPWLITLCEMNLCGLPVKRSFRMTMLLFSVCIYLSVLTVGYSQIFYRSLTLEQAGEAWVQKRVYGPMHAVHYVCIGLYMAVDIAVLVYTYLKKKQVSRLILFLLFLPIPVTSASYMISHRLMAFGYELTPMTYTLAQIVYLLIVRRLSYYNVGGMAMETMVQSGETGFITVDYKGRYLGSNETAKSVLPELKQLTVDQQIRKADVLGDTVLAWLNRFERDPGDCRFLYETRGDDPKIYHVSAGYLFDGRRQCGYQIFLQDDTQNQKYIRLLDRYNADLQAEVAAKTERVIAMHDRLVLGMAAMVESRDNSTGGHIRRTSQGVRILIETIRERGGLPLSDSFCKGIIKAAPMHDLGKIAVDDAILRKPGRFTPEEYEKMKSHTTEGARIVHEILRDTDDDAFRRLAENVAHYHHERMDGSGYPKGLKGEEIPLEARIMAIADVYDALVSKRVYKDAMPFDQADRIILEGMGAQFDAGLKRYYEQARPRLEAYYREEARQAAESE